MPVQKVEGAGVGVSNYSGMDGNSSHCRLSMDGSVKR